MSMSSHTHPQNVHVESSMTVTDGSAGLLAAGALMSLTHLLHGDVESLARWHSRPVGVAVHQRAREVAVGDEQQPWRQFVAGGRGHCDIDLPAGVRRDAHTTAVDQAQPLHVRRCDLQGRDLALVCRVELPFADTASLLAGPPWNEDKSLQHKALCVELD